MQSSAGPHLALSVSVALVSVGITLSGMSVIVDQKYLWAIGLVVGMIGIIYGIISLAF